ILLRPGTYSGDNNRDLNFQQTDQLGGMTSSSRDLVLMGEKGPDSTIIDLSGFGATPNRFLDVTSGEGPGTKLLGLTIQNGQATNGNPIIKVENSQLVIENCKFLNNSNNESFGSVVLTGNNLSHITVNRSQFIGNSGPNVSGVFFADNIDIYNSIFYHLLSEFGPDRCCVWMESYSRIHGQYRKLLVFG
ncbi:MAG: hypothetical protein GXO90_10075, partial [FCB group bacterium]|nr:hypothetical protein [FCB group bacterium]